MNDTQLQLMILRRYYEGRKEGFVHLNSDELDGVDLSEIYRISEQLHENGLIEFKPLRANDTIVAGVGKITGKGVS